MAQLVSAILISWRGLRLQQTFCRKQLRAQMTIMNIEFHSQNEQDWYAATIAVDILAFLYVLYILIFYQARQSPLSLLSSQRPFSYQAYLSTHPKFCETKQACFFELAALLRISLSKSIDYIV